MADTIHDKCACTDLNEALFRVQALEAENEALRADRDLMERGLRTQVNEWRETARALRKAVEAGDRLADWVDELKHEQNIGVGNVPLIEFRRAVEATRKDTEGES